MIKRLHPNEGGTVALIVALSAVMLFSVGALAVDLGNAYTRKRSAQSDADFAAFAAVAGGANLPAATATPLATDPAVIAAAKYVNANLATTDNADSSTCWVSGTSVTAAMLVDGKKCNGEVYYGHFKSDGTIQANKNEITVLTPESKVSFGLANAMGLSSTTLQAHATVAIKSAKIPVLPFYAYTGCDYGPQTISEPNNGHAASSVLLSHGSEPTPSNSNTATLTALNPNTVTPGDTTSSLVITGTNFTGVTQVGFFESGNSSPGPEPVTVAVPAGSVTATQITVAAPLPTAVTSVQNVWYVRVLKNGQWSNVLNGSGTLNALTFTVGNALLTCGQGSNDGNFGTLKFQSSGQWQETAKNIAVGLDHALAPFPDPGTGQGANFLCSATTPADPFRTKLWPTEGTNCVDTETGMAQNAATSGFVKGLYTGGYNFNGLLTKGVTDNTTGCNGLPATKPFLGNTINNDTLSCFFTDTTTNIGNIDSATYSLPGPVLDKKIWNSPRFIFVPVLGVEPGNGGSNKYQIVSFRPGFITDQTEVSTKTTAATANNGLTPSNNGNEVQSVQVVFFNPSALPDPPSGPLQDYIPGAGPKVVRLVD